MELFFVIGFSDSTVSKINKEFFMNWATGMLAVSGLIIFCLIAAFLSKCSECREKDRKVKNFLLAFFRASKPYIQLPDGDYSVSDRVGEAFDTNIVVVLNSNGIGFAVLCEDISLPAHCERIFLPDHFRMKSGVLYPL